MTGLDYYEDDHGPLADGIEVVNPLGVLEKKDIQIADGGPIFCVPPNMAGDPDLVKKKDGKIVKVGPYRVTEIEYFEDSGEHQVIMKTFNWWTRYASVKIKDVLKRTKSRIILTYVVWGLADFEIMVIPGWCDIRMIGKVVGAIRSGLSWIGEKVHKET